MTRVSRFEDEVDAKTSMRGGDSTRWLVSVCLVVHVTACELRAFAKKCVDIPEGIGRSDAHATRRESWSRTV